MVGFNVGCTMIDEDVVVVGIDDNDNGNGDVVLCASFNIFTLLFVLMLLLATINDGKLALIPLWPNDFGGNVI